MIPLSDHYNGKIFLNPVPTEVMRKGAMGRMLKKLFQKHPGRTPQSKLGPFFMTESFEHPVSPSGLKVSWLGHSSLILEMDGLRLLTDPLWYERASPFKYLGPKRFFANPLAIEKLPSIDYILLSHDHYDHLDRSSIIKLADKNIPIITMLKVGEQLRKWGIKKELVRELDWWESTELTSSFHVIAAPARHFSGRSLFDRFSTLWGAFILKGPVHSVFFGADSGYFEGFTTIGEQFGPFHLTLLEIGAYNDDWPFIHMGPENAIKAHQALRGQALLPLHWGTFNLAFHPWKEPVIRLKQAAAANGTSLILPPPGELYEVSNGEYDSGWWQHYE